MKDSPRYNCDRLVWFERHQFIHKAIARSRSKKIALVESLNVAWVNLSREWFEVDRL